MFADACAKAVDYVKPVVESIRTNDGKISSFASTFIILNSEGWFITAGHVFDKFLCYQKDIKKISEIEDLRKKGIESPIDNNLITNQSFWWGWDGVSFTDAFIHRQLDLCIGKLVNFNPSWVSNYPILGDSGKTRRGMSLCRLGYPLLQFDTGFDSERKAFRIPKISAEDCIFPNECICTRFISKGRSYDNLIDLKYIETSTPGLRGQSGGPIMDKNGIIRAMQVETNCISLDFHPTIEYNGSTVVESQFLNVGIGIDVQVIRELLDSKHIQYRAEGDESGYRIVD